MSQITLEIANTPDLELLLSLVKRLDIKVISLETEMVNKRTQQINQLKTAAIDPLFLADVESIKEDFKYSDAEQIGVTTKNGIFTEQI